MRKGAATGRRYNVIRRRAEAIAKVTPVLKAAGVGLEWVSKGRGLNGVLSAWDDADRIPAGASKL